MSPRPILHKAANARMRRSARHERDARAGSADRSFRQIRPSTPPRRRESADPILKHVVVTLQLPLFKISETQYQEALTKYNNVMAQVEKDPACASRVAFMARDWHHGVRSKRYEQLQKDPGRNVSR